MRDLVRAYRPARPSVWRDLALFCARTYRDGLPMLAVFALVPVFSLLLEALK